MGETADDAEMRQAFNAAFAEFGFHYSTGCDTTADGSILTPAGESFAATLSAALDTEVQQRRQQRQAHIDRCLAPKAHARPRSVCATAPPLALAVTPPRATAMA